LAFLIGISFSLLFVASLFYLKKGGAGLLNFQNNFACSVTLKGVTDRGRWGYLDFFSLSLFSSKIA